MFAAHHHRQHFARVFRVQQHGRHSTLTMANAVVDPAVDDDTIAQQHAPDESDYGSDLDDATIDELFSQPLTPSQARLPPAPDTEDVEEPVIPQRDESELQSDILRLPRADVEALLASLGHATALVQGALDQPAHTLNGTPEARLDSPGSGKVRLSKSGDIVSPGMLSRNEHWKPN